MRKSVWIFAVCAVFICAGSVCADTPDGQTPAEETVCDNEEGAAYGLCNAYCEAMDCDSPSQRASDKGCEAVRRNFERKTGRTMPCAVACPCPAVLQVFADIVNGTVGVDRCIADDNVLFVITDQGDTAFIDDGPPVNCNVNGEPPFVELTPAERAVCRITIREAVEATGVICRRSE